MQDVAQVAELVGMGVSTVYRILALYRRTGDVVRTPLLSGRPRILDSMEADYVENLVVHTPDLYLHEIQRLLEENCDVNVSLPTIYRALIQRNLS